MGDDDQCPILRTIDAVSSDLLLARQHSAENAERECEFVTRFPLAHETRHTSGLFLQM